MFGIETTINLVVKGVIILALALVTILGAYFIPRGKFIVVIVGVCAILIIWYVDIDINL